MKRRSFTVISVLSALLCAAGTAQAQPNANSHLLSADNLVQIAAHVWMIKGSPNIGAAF